MPISLPAISEWNPVRIVKAIKDLGTGRSNAHGIAPLNVAPATTTTVVAPTGDTSAVYLQPDNAAAISDRASTYVSSVSRGSFVITHPSNAAARTVRWGFKG